MPKRNTTVQAIDALSAGDEAALKAKQAALAAIPDPTFMDGLSWDSVFADRAFNVRFDEAYDFKNNQELFASLRENGLQTRGGDNMSFSEQRDGTYKVISGNLRYAMMASIRNKVSEERNAIGEPTDEGHPLPFETIKGLVFKGLSYEQELDLMADHTMKKGLNEAELAKEIGELTHHHGLTDAKAAVKFGLDKNKIARLRMTYAMPTVFAEFRKEKGKDKSQAFVKVGQVQRQTLYTAYLADVAAGNAFRVEGPNFRRAWTEFLKNPVAAPTDVKVKSKDKDVIDGQRKSLAATFGNNPEVALVADILAWTSNEPGTNLNTSMEALIDLIQTLRTERDGAIDKATSLADEVKELKHKAKDAEKESQGMSDELESVKAELESVKASHKPKAKKS